MWICLVYDMQIKLVLKYKRSKSNSSLGLHCLQDIFS